MSPRPTLDVCGRKLGIQLETDTVKLPLQNDFSRLLIILIILYGHYKLQQVVTTFWKRTRSGGSLVENRFEIFGIVSFMVKKTTQNLQKKTRDIYNEPFFFNEIPFRCFVITL